MGRERINGEIKGNHELANVFLFLPTLLAPPTALAFSLFFFLFLSISFLNSAVSRLCGCGIITPTLSESKNYGNLLPGSFSKGLMVGPQGMQSKMS